MPRRIGLAWVVGWVVLGLPVRAQAQDVPPPERAPAEVGRGVTAGLALSFQAGRPLHLSTARQDAAATTALPFLQATPMHWIQPERGAQCARRETSPGFLPCLGHQFGLFLGRPLAYEARTTVPREALLERVREIRPLVALGLSYAPIPEVSLLVGWMHGRISRERGGEVPVGALVLGLGATVDLLR